MAKHFSQPPTDEAEKSAAQGQHAEPLGKSAESVKPVREPIKRPEKKNNMVSNILIAVGVLLLVIAGVIFAINTMNYKKIDQENERVAEYARLSDDDEQPPVVDWAALKEMNPDAVGWIQVPGTIVNYPVFKTDNNDYYLNHAPDRSDSIGGSVFMDYEGTAPGMVDQQTIIYGHHMRNGSQFKPIADMENQEAFDGVKTVWYVTEGAAYKLAPLFLYYTSEDDTEVRQFQFDSVDAFRAYLNKYASEAKASRPDLQTALAAVNHVLTLSTCNYYDGYGRTLLVCAPKSEIPGTKEYVPSTPAPANPAPEENKGESEENGDESSEEPSESTSENTSEGTTTEGTSGTAAQNANAGTVEEGSFQ